MSRSLKNWLWVVLVVWGMVLCALAEAHAEDALVKATQVPLTAVEERQVLDISDAAQVAGKAYVVKQQAYLDFIKSLSAKKHYPEGTAYKVDFDPSKCVPMPDGMMKCQRKIVPVFPTAKSNVPPPAAPVPTSKDKP